MERSGLIELASKMKVRIREQKFSINMQSMQHKSIIGTK